MNQFIGLNQSKYHFISASFNIWVTFWGFFFSSNFWVIHFQIKLPNYLVFLRIWILWFVLTCRGLDNISNIRDGLVVLSVKFIYLCVIRPLEVQVLIKRKFYYYCEFCCFTLQKVPYSSQMQRFKIKFLGFANNW